MFAGLYRASKCSGFRPNCRFKCLRLHHGQSTHDLIVMLTPSSYAAGHAAGSGLASNQPSYKLPTEPSAQESRTVSPSPFAGTSLQMNALGCHLSVFKCMIDQMGHCFACWLEDCMNLYAQDVAQRCPSSPSFGPVVSRLQGAMARKEISRAILPRPGPPYGRATKSSGSRTDLCSCSGEHAHVRRNPIILIRLASWV